MPLRPYLFTLPFLYKEQRAPNTYSFFFDRSKASFDFQPGQYIRMTLLHDKPDDRGTNRFFTISSSPLQKDVLIITAKIIKSSFKEALLQLVPGDEVTFFGPMGNFLLQEDNSREHIFLSGGMGVTPFHSMLLYAAEKKLSKKLTLIASFSTEEELIFYEELKTIAAKHPTINTIYTVSGSAAQTRWRGEKGRLSEQLIKKYVRDVQDAIYYVVGPQSMVHETKELLAKLAIDEEMIMSEDFTGY